MSAAVLDELLADSAGELLDARLLRIITPAAPAVGAELSITVPGGDVWEIHAFRVTLTASAVAGNRVPNLVLDDGKTEFLRTASASAIAVGTVGEISTFPGAGVDVTIGTLRILPFPTPRTLLVGGWRLRTVTTALDVGDAYTAPVVCVRRLSMADLQQAADWLGRQTISAEIPT